MLDDAKHKIVILGGGTSGWMSAAVLARFLNPKKYSIHLIESEQVGTVGVGEATLPPIRDINYLLGINEADFLAATHATFKLGIRFDQWGTRDSSYLHTFGVHGRQLDGIHFHHYWLQAKRVGLDIPEFADFSLASILAKRHQFRHPPPPAVGQHTHSYAYHIDAVAYATFLRKCAEQNGVIRHEGIVKTVNIDKTNGDISSLELGDHSIHAANLFIDCSGFKALLIGDTLGVDYEDWSQWLPCNRAYAGPTSLMDSPPPYTVSTAQSAGWQWRIPLQNRMGNGLVFASDFISETAAETQFRANCEGELSSPMKKFQFTAGRRKSSWVKNCVSIGLSSGFLEPLESTSIHLAQAAIYKLIELLPEQGGDSIERDEFNRTMALEYERVRDFIILHYKLNRRDDSDFWRYCANMAIPESLTEKINLFENTGHVVEYEQGSFGEPSWLSVYLGQGLTPKQVHPLVSQLSHAELMSKLNGIVQELSSASIELSNHLMYLHHLLNNKQVEQHRPGQNFYGK